jgi:hypothetical protein
MKNSLKLVALLALVAAISAPVTARVAAPVVAGPALSSIGPLAFAPDGVLFAADKQAATIFALDLGAQASSATAGTADVPAIATRWRRCWALPPPRSRLAISPCTRSLTTRSSP